MKIYCTRILANLLIVLLFRVNLIATKFMWMLSGNDPCSERFLGARLGYLHRNLVAQASNLGAPGYRAPVRQQPCYMLTNNEEIYKIKKHTFENICKVSLGKPLCNKGLLLPDKLIHGTFESKTCSAGTWWQLGELVCSWWES